MSESQHRSLGLQDGYAVSKRLYHITIEAIMRSDFMNIQSCKTEFASSIATSNIGLVYSVQAIAVVLMCAHALGYVCDLPPVKTLT